MASNATKETLQSMHQQQLLNGSTNITNTIQIVNILGGIDNILTNYLSETSNISISSHELNELHQIISPTTTLQTPTIKHKDHIASIISSASSSSSFISNSLNFNMEVPEKNLYLTLNEHETYLYTLFGADKASKIMSVIHSQIMGIFILILVISNAIIVTLNDSILKYITITILCGFIWTPYVILWSLSVNRKAFKLILKSFEFWLKVIYAFIYGSLHVWYDIGYDSDHTDSNVFTFKLIAGIANSIIGLPLGVICISLLDASNMRKIWKVLLSITCASVLSVGCILDTLYEFGNINHAIVTITNGVQFSLLSAVAHALRIVCIFFWKQAILSLRLMKYDKSVLIRYAPNIRWFKDNGRQNMGQYCQL